MKAAFMGFRHGHIMGLYTAMTERKDLEIVAACEEDARTREEIQRAGRVRLTHDSYTAMLDQVDADILAVGDYYGRRGPILIEALERGLHVIADKPICTSLTELDRIAALSRQKGLRVGCMLDLRDSGRFRRVRELVQQGAIGEVHAVAFGGQHPLMPKTRPAWYFEPGKHGGTINDIAIHAFDLIPWITGLDFAEAVAARTWNAFAPQYPHFNDAAQFMLKMSNDGGVLGDVSYFMPDSQGYSLRQYWRMTFFGREGIIETTPTEAGLFLARSGRTDVETVAPLENVNAGCLSAFLADIEGTVSDGQLATEPVLRASRWALEVQAAADTGQTQVRLS